MALKFTPDPLFYHDGVVSERGKSRDRVSKFSRSSNGGLRSAKDRFINSKVREGGDMKEAVDTIEYSAAVCL
jgi:hypothetical protein